LRPEKKLKARRDLRRIFMPGIYIAFSGARFSVDFNPFPK